MTNRKIEEEVVQIEFKALFYSKIFCLCLKIVFFYLIITLIYDHLEVDRLIHLFSKTKSEALTMVNCLLSLGMVLATFLTLSVLS